MLRAHHHRVGVGFHHPARNRGAAELELLAAHVHLPGRTDILPVRSSISAILLV